jgi:uncharacterized protein (DUF1697 family)
MKYVALLRGINVGGKSIVSMAELRAVTEQAGMANVTTYINSGNLLFESDLKKSEITDLLTKTIEQAFGLPIMVIVLAKDDVLRLAKALPSHWTNGADMKCDVMFLHANVDHANIVKQLKVTPEIDNIVYAPGAVMWAVDRKHVTKSGLLKIIGTPLYKQMTVRNCNTLRKLVTLLSD